MEDNIPGFVPQDANGEEAAAIVAAVSTYIQEQNVEAKDDPSWQGNRWQFASRMDAVLQRSPRIPTDAPTDGWSASGRAGRMG
ncbi:acc operon protein [Natronomonas gomsonensis]|jgi:hypothetical protein|uniref:acc operon protein n=1 Tax=Natronomonas gomsonensis TaxID=1046043 RepID=UPI00227A590F|nr:acc operon protein [Natronomonas gomsonensis]